MTRYQLLKIPGIHNIFTFGKYKGKTLLEVLDNDAQYIVWCIHNIENFTIDSQLKKELLEQYNSHMSGARQEHHYMIKTMKTYGLCAADFCALQDAQEV